MAEAVSKRHRLRSVVVVVVLLVVVVFFLVVVVVDNLYGVFCSFMF